MDQIIEAVSAKVHENWMASKRAAGVESRKLESGEELMVPYEQLTDAAKELDRGTVRTVLAVLPDLGFQVIACTCTAKGNEPHAPFCTATQPQ